MNLAKSGSSAEEMAARIGQLESELALEKSLREEEVSGLK